MSQANLQNFKRYISSIIPNLSNELSCNYYSEQELNSIDTSLLDSSNNLSLFHLNIRSLNANHSKLFQLITSLKIKFDAILLTEVWSFNILLYNCLFPDYNFHYVLPLNSNVCAYIHSSLSVVERNDLNFDSLRISNPIESLFFELSKVSYHFLLGCIYRHP